MSSRESVVTWAQFLRIYHLRFKPAPPIRNIMEIIAGSFFVHCTNLDLLLDQSSPFIQYHWLIGYWHQLVCHLLKTRRNINNSFNSNRLHIQIYYNYVIVGPRTVVSFLSRSHLIEIGKQFLDLGGTMKLKVVSS